VLTSAPRRFPGRRRRGGSDNASFVCAGAPAFGLGSLSWDYGTYTWHTNRDTYDKIVASTTCGRTRRSWRCSAYLAPGTTPADMEGWGWRSVHDPAVLPAVLERWAASIASGRPFEMTFPLRGADGRFRPFLTRVAPVRGPDGAVARWIGTNTDVAAERAARERAERLQAITAALARARTAADVGALFSRELRDAVGADTCWVGRLTPDGGRIETLGYAGLRAAVMEARWARWPAELPSAARDVLRDGRARWYRAKAALVADYPAAADGLRELDQEAVVVLPLALGEARLGALTVGFRDERDPDPDALAFYEAMAAQCAQALARARLYEAEQTARRRTEELQALTAGLAAARAPDEVGAVVAARGVAALGAAHATVAALDEDGGATAARRS
jgi:GAF domain-containing protein